MKRKESRVRSVTLKMIAKEANVSPATVSLALNKNKNSTRVSQKTRHKIIEIASHLNYRPNYIAKSLVTKKTKTIGLVITTLLNPFYAEIAQDIIERSEEAGYSVVICSMRDELLPGSQRSVDELLMRGVDGLIICSSLLYDPLINELVNQSVPFVLTLRNIKQEPGDEHVDFVGVDNRRGAYIATEHLLKIGHIRIAHLAGPLGVSTGYKRKIGWECALNTCGVQIDPDPVLEGDFHRHSGYEFTKELLKRYIKPTAIFAANDYMAIGVLDALQEKKLKAPDDMAVVGFDDIEIAGLPGINLTTVSQKKATMGRLTVDFLIEKIKNGSEDLGKRIILDPILMIRKSCGFHIIDSNMQGRETDVAQRKIS